MNDDGDDACDGDDGLLIFLFLFLWYLHVPSAATGSVPFSVLTWLLSLDGFFLLLALSLSLSLFPYSVLQCFTPGK